MSDCPAFLAFCKQVGDDVASNVLQEVCEAHYAGGDNTETVRISTRHRHDAINYTIEGTVTHDGQTYGFLIDDGNWNGTVVREWGDPEEMSSYEPPPPPRYDMVPKNPNLKEESPFKYAVYLAWRKAPWFGKMLGDYAYDSHFAPGNKTEDHYRGMADKRGLKIVRLEDAP